MNALNSPKQSNWTLDPRLRADTLKLGEYSHCDVLLMDDSRWPWLIIVPHVTSAEELQDLSQIQQQEVMQLAIAVGKALKSVTRCEKLNTAAIGNIVRQLHIHVVARSKGDANWPAPVWGFGTAQKYGPEESSKFVLDIKSQLKA